MTTEWNYLKESKQMRQGSQFEPHTITHRMKVIDCGTPETAELLTPQDVLDKLSQGGAAAGGYKAMVGSPFEYFDGSYVDASTEYGAWITRSIDVTPLPNQRYSWDVTITQTNMGRLVTSSATEDDPASYIGDIDVAFNQTSLGKKQQAWRSIPAVAEDTMGSSAGTYLMDFCPEPWKFCSSTDDDIGGVDIAINKAQPIQITTSSTQINIEWVVRGPITKADGTIVTPYVNADDVAPYLAIPTLESMIGSRNADTLGQFEPGYLLMESIGVQPMHYEFKRVSMVMSYDPWKHAMQRPWVTTSGPVIGVESCPSDGEEQPDILNLGALAVGWVQPYLGGFTFGSDPDALFNNGFFPELMAWMMGSYEAGESGTCS